MSRSTLHRSTALAAVFLMLAAVAAEARPSGSRSSGSRGSQTYSAPPATNTAPTTAQPMQRTVTPAPAPGVQQPARPATAQPGVPPRPGQAPAPQRSPLGALGMGLAAGFLGAGLFGMLSGQGFLAGLGSFAGMLGFLIQALLIGGLIWLAVRFIRSRRAAMGAPEPAYARTGPAAPPPGGPQMMGAGGSMGMPAAQPSDKIGVSPQDFDQFERRLQEVQDAYSREDLQALRAVATPEMVSYFADDLAENAKQGVVNRISDVKLLQGDLSEAWREPDSDYATVAMRYALTDVTVERAGGRVVAGKPQGEEVTEVWTFRRPHGGVWQLSAIQQV
ncbi:MAG: TIM44-like domain-containing protein [Alphaproteobacteria bacterium]